MVYIGDNFFSKMNEYFRNKNFEFIIKEGILYVKYLTEILNLEVAQEGVKERLNFVNGRSFPVIVDIGNLKREDRLARLYFAEPESSHLIKSCAIVVKNVFQKTASSIYIYFNKPSRPTKVFDSYDEAVFWIKNFRC